MSDADRQRAYGRLQGFARHPHPSDRLHTHWREILAGVAVCAGLFIFATLAAIAGGIA